MLRTSQYLINKQRLGGRTRKYLFESWYSGPYTWAPESDTNSFSGMVKLAIKFLKGVADTNGTPEPLTLTSSSGGGTLAWLAVANGGDSPCLPALAGIAGDVPGVATRYFTTNGIELTTNILTAEGLCLTGLLLPGGSTNLLAVTLAEGLAAPTNENASLEAFWNPQDPLGIVRSRQSFTPGLLALGPWQDTDLGSVGLSGGVALSSNALTVLGSGADIWGAADACHFLYQSVSGNGTFTARVAAQVASDLWAKAGVMVRESTATNARHVFMCVTPNEGVAFQNRPGVGGSSYSVGIGGLIAPYWVRLVRSGSSFSGYASPDGTSWTQMGGATNISGFASNALWGLAVTAHNNSLASAAVFDNITVYAAGHAPTLAPIAATNILAGRTLAIQAVASDPDLPAQPLSYQLLNAPAGMSVDPASGLITWRPAVAPSPYTTNATLMVSDNGRPPMTATQSFSITVSRPAQPQLSAPALTDGVFALKVNGMAGPDYILLTSTNLSNWTPLQTNFSPVPPFVFLDARATNFSRRFYRAQLGP